MVTEHERIGKLWKDAVERMDRRYDAILYRMGYNNASQQLRTWHHERWMQLFIEYQIAMGWLPRR